MRRTREKTRRIASGARAILRESLRERIGPGPTIDVQWVRRIGAGLSRDIFASRVVIEPDEQGLSGAYVVQMPRPDSDPDLDERTLREESLLRQLRRERLPFRIPDLLGAVRRLDDLIMIRSYLEGQPLDMRLGRQEGFLPWRVVADVAAAVHSVAFDEWSFEPAGPATRREHALEKMAPFEGLVGLEIDAARQWAIEHLPPPVPTVLIHGDLLGQNILVHPDQPLAVIDWEYGGRGDPAYDLAIVTRGVERPFLAEDGFDRLLGAYREAGGADLDDDDVRFYEVCMGVKWYRNALEGRVRHTPERALEVLRSILRTIADH